MSECHIIKRGHLYLHDYSEEIEGIQSDPIWDFNWIGLLLFDVSYGLQVAENVRGTLYEVEDPDCWNHQTKIGVMVRSFE